MIAFVFPGQGSQKRGMGEGLFDEIREYAALEKEVDELLGYSLRRLCLNDPEGRLKETQYTQPCLYVVNALHYYKELSQGIRPSCLAGHSLGEYNALWAAGVFDFLTGLRLVKKRGELMAQAKNGGMAAVIGLSERHVAQVIRESSLSAIDVANFNSPTQIVISGPVDDIKRARPFFEKAGARVYIPLEVSAAFHSRYMIEAARTFGGFIRPMSFAAPSVPVIANVTAIPYAASNPSETIKSLLVEQITKPVLWTQSIGYIIDNGITEFKEIGPGSALTKMIRLIEAEKME
jgi:malonyl CoA-acyl carrier protein transacylase